MSVAEVFSPDHERYEGVRPINIYLLRLLYFLMASFVATSAWMTILNHVGPWDRFQRADILRLGRISDHGGARTDSSAPDAADHAVHDLLQVDLAAHRRLCRCGSAGALWGSPAETMTRAFLWLPLLIVAVPWGYVLRTYVLPSRSRRNVPVLA